MLFHGSTATTILQFLQWMGNLFKLLTVSVTVKILISVVER